MKIFHSPSEVLLPGRNPSAFADALNPPPSPPPDRSTLPFPDRPGSSNSRRHPRYPLSLPCIIEWPGGKRILGVVVDLSLGGVCLHTEASVEALRFFTLEVIEPGFELHLTCEVREVRDLWDKRVVHASFAQAAPRPGVDGAVDHARQRHLASEASSHSFVRVLRDVFRRRAVYRLRLGSGPPFKTASAQVSAASGIGRACRAPDTTRFGHRAVRAPSGPL